MKIGMLDSGVGGLTIVKAVQQSFPQLDIVFIGDNARAPYGSRSKIEIQMFSEQLMQFLLEQGVDLIVIACNTISTLHLQDFEDKFNLPVIGIIFPTAKLAYRLSHQKALSLIATERTVNSQVYQRYLQSFGQETKVYELATPRFVPVVEANLMGDKKALDTVQEDLSVLKKHDFDTLILGCTHYPFLIEEIQASLAPHVQVVDASMAIAEELRPYVADEAHGKKGKVELFTTASHKNFQTIADSFFDSQSYQIQQIHLQ